MSKVDKYGDYREPTVAAHELHSQKSDGDNIELARLGKKPVLRVSSPVSYRQNRLDTLCDIGSAPKRRAASI